MGLQYTLENRQNFLGIPTLDKDRVRAALQSAVDKAAMAASKTTKNMKAKPGGDLRKSLAVAVTEVPPILVDHVLHVNKFDTSTKPAAILEDDSLLEALVKCLLDAREIVDNITSSDTCPGYILAKRQGSMAAARDDAGEPESLLYEDFHPFLPNKFQDDGSIRILEFDGFNRTVDEFFSSLEGQKLESRLHEREAAAKRKLDAAKQDQSKRIEGLQEAQTSNFRKAAAIEANVERVQEAMDAVNGLLQQGMDWVDIGKLVEREKKRQNPVADMIVLPLKLDENMISLELMEEEEEDDDAGAGADDPFETDDSDSETDDSSKKPAVQNSNSVRVDISLSLTPWGNARDYYGERRTAAVKEEKTQQQAEKALKSTEQKIKADLNKGLKKEKALLQPVRQQFWFEKFFWFISSDGYLVLAGKDQAQDELLYRRHLRKGDIFCHSDVKDASIVVIKNKSSDSPIPPATLSQAANFSICTSEAWDSKAGMGAWWVNAEQVSKMNSSGEVLLPGNFNIKEPKNHLPPGQLLLGLGILFRISEESKAKHPKHRAAVGAEPSSTSEASSDFAGTGQSRRDTAKASPDQDAALESNNDDDDNDDQRTNPLQSRKMTSAAESVADEEKLEGLNDNFSAVDISNDQQPTEEDASQSDGEARGDKPEASQQLTKPNHDTKSAVQNKTQLKRGQRSKAKKIAAKYKDQDDDDRAAAEALIGAAAGARKAEVEAQAKADREAELEATKERRRAQHVRRQRETVEHEEKRRAMMLEGNNKDADDETEAHVPLDTLVGTPRAGDEILEVITVCAPIAALGKVKYKVKMQPGPMKKGKAVKEIVERWKLDSGKKGVIDDMSQDSERMWPREVELIKSLKAEEMVNAVPAGKVRLMVSGGSGGKGGNTKGGKGGGKGKK